MKVIFVYSANSSAGGNPIVENQARSLRSAGVEIVMFPVSRKGFAGYSGYVLRLRKRLKTDNCQIIHAHYGLSGLAAIFARTGEKLVVSFMGSDLLGDYNMKGRALKYLNLILARRMADYAIVKTEEMAAITGKSGSLSTVPNGVDISLFVSSDKNQVRDRLNIPKDAEVILFVGDPGRTEKNISLALKAIERTGKRFTLLKVSGKPHEEMPLYYSAADLLVMTSLHEGSPNTVKEAMACNCPVVSTPVGDVPFLLNGIQGCYVSSSDEQEFADNINRAMEFALRFDRTAGRERLLALGLDSETVAGRIRDIYEKVLESK